MELPMKEERRGSQAVFTAEVLFDANLDRFERRHSIRIRLRGFGGEQLSGIKQIIQAVRSRSGTARL